MKAYEEIMNALKLYYAEDGDVLTDESVYEIIGQAHEPLGTVAKALDEYRAANSPELPDGWIKCSERMPADCQTVLCNNMLTELSGIPFIADYVGMFELHDGTRYEAGFYINRTPQTVTHWMPLPAPPTTEK
ncbi:hypothetical protein L580_2755 [Serratia fonticola AU-P3(3)]|nr:hypothetical protein L580_2755 [Serratia fonticola AU-P3(3)]